MDGGGRGLLERVGGFFHPQGYYRKCVCVREKEERMADKDDTSSQKQQIGARCLYCKTLNLSWDKKGTQFLVACGQLFKVSIFPF